MKTTFPLGIILIFAAAASAITIETVPIGDVGNSNDPATGNLYGGVDYAYSIGKYEVTIAQYVAFLNAVAKTDTYGIYDIYNQQIERSGTSGNYTYTAHESPNHPVGLYWTGAARFANWLHNGQPTGDQNASTTEDGAYSLNGVPNDIYPRTPILRNPNAKWFIPSESEWYKAAYYQPADKGGDVDSYWKYPMRTNDVPYSDQPPGATPDNTRVGNFYKGDGIANGYDDGYAVSGANFDLGTPNLLTDVGAYTLAAGYYGTFDQGGNLSEWNERDSRSNVQPFRGGSYYEGANYLQSSVNFHFSPGTLIIGFRVATIAAVPELPTNVLFAYAVLVVSCSQRYGIPKR